MTNHESLYEMAIEDIQEANATWNDMYDDNGGMHVSNIFGNVRNATGASKIAFLDNKYGDFVIKLPIRGEARFGQCSLENHCYDCSVCDDCDECSHYDEDAQENSDNDVQDYCEKEVLVYNRAKKYKLDFLFAAEEFLGNVNDIPVYVQERVAEIECDSDKVASRKSLDTVRSRFGYVDLPSNFAANVLQYYNRHTLKRLLRFIRKNRLNDFHSHNCGYFADGRPVLFDYSGFGC